MAGVLRYLKGCVIYLAYSEGVVSLKTVYRGSTKCGHSLYLGRLLRSCETELNLFYGRWNESTTISKSVKLRTTVGQCGKLFAVPSQINQAAKALPSVADCP